MYNDVSVLTVSEIGVTMSNKSVAKTFRFKPEIAEMLKRLAKRERRSMTNLIEVMLLEREQEARARGLVVSGSAAAEPCNDSV